VSSEWEFKNDHLVMVGLEPSEPDQMGPRPWEVDDLTIGKGDRVVVAASKSNAWRVADAVTAADKAAKVADTLAKWESPPSRGDPPGGEPRPRAQSSLSREEVMRTPLQPLAVRTRRSLLPGSDRR